MGGRRREGNGKNGLDEETLSAAKGQMGPSIICPYGKLNCKGGQIKKKTSGGDVSSLKERSPKSGGPASSPKSGILLNSVGEDRFPGKKFTHTMMRAGEMSVFPTEKKRT